MNSPRKRHCYVAALLSVPGINVGLGPILVWGGGDSGHFGVLGGRVEWIFLPLVGCQAVRPASEQIKLLVCVCVNVSGELLV